MSRRKLFVGGGTLVVVGVSCWLFPLFHVRTLGDGATATRAEASANRPGLDNPIAYIDQLWNGPLRTEDAAVEINQFWDAFDQNAASLQEQFGRQAGLGGAWYYCVRGQGVVEEIEDSECILSVADGSRRACLTLGLVVDNTVRDAIGVNANRFANSQQFNAVSAELNRRVEQQIIAPSRPLLKRGAVVRFVGCCKVASASDVDPLCMIPIRIELLTHETQAAGAGDAADGAPSP